MREAHPGEHLGPHESFEDKLAAARRLREELGIARPILVDDLAGSVHAEYGLLPNMSWVIARGGRILYKAMWTSAARVADFLERPGAGRDRRHAPYYSEQLEARDLDRAAFQRGLERNGPRAVEEFARAEQIWAERERASS